MVHRALLMTCLALLLAWPGPAGSGRAQAADGPAPGGTGVLAGRVSLGPLSPVEHPGQPLSGAAARGVKILVYGPGRQEIASVLTDEAGQFRVNLPPGSFLVEMAPIKGKAFTKDLPATVTITAGQETRLNVQLDTGLR